MQIRAHHLICRFGFKGLGYDERFIRVMEEVMITFRLNPELNLKVLASSDILCAACPNCRDDICYDKDGHVQEEQIKKMDRFVLSILKLDEGEMYTLKEINQRIVDYFTVDKLASLCEDCEWRNYGYCRKGLQKFKDKNTKRA